MTICKPEKRSLLEFNRFRGGQNPDLPRREEMQRSAALRVPNRTNERAPLEAHSTMLPYRLYTAAVSLRLATCRTAVSRQCARYCTATAFSSDNNSALAAYARGKKQKRNGSTQQERGIGECGRNGLRADTIWARLLWRPLCAHPQMLISVASCFIISCFLQLGIP
jgi:hypothetical protein